MPKVKTKKIILKRIKVTKNGKVLRTQGFRRHLNVKKSSTRKRRLKGTVMAKKVFSQKLKKALGK